MKQSIVQKKMEQTSILLNRNYTMVVKKIKIAIYSLDLIHYACSDIRLISPLNNLNQFFDLCWAASHTNNTYKIDFEPIDWADIIIIHRYFPLAETKHVLDRMSASGKPLIYEIDDFLLDTPRTHPLFHNFQKTVPYIRDFLPTVDLVTVSTEHLRKQLTPYNSQIATIPNLINESYIAPSIPVSDKNTTTIAYMGSPTHNQDLELVEETLFKIREKYGNCVQFIFWGCAGKKISKLGLTIPFCQNYASFLKSLGRIHFDIGLAPLTDNSFNRCKSNIKWLEYSAYGRAGVYSDLEPYRESIAHFKTGILAGNDPQKWFESLDYLITHPTERIAMGRAARRSAFNLFGLSKRSNIYFDTYSKLLQR